MANSKIGQHLLEFQLSGYTAPARSHVVRAWISPTGVPAIGTPPASVTIQKLGGATANLQVVADQFWSYLRLSYPAAIVASGFSLWRYVTENSRDFITAGTLATPAGSNGGAADVAGQCTLTFRHALGGIGKLVLIESVNPGNTQVALVPNGAGNNVQRIAAYLLSADGPMVALDNSFPIAALRDSRGQNEAVFKKVYRGT